MNAPPIEKPGGFVDHFALWAALGAGLFAMPAGALLVPALSIERAILATVIAAALGSLLVASVVALAARSGRNTLDLLAAPFGDAARPAIAAALLGRHLLFVAFALILITDSATLIGQRSIGADLRVLWAALFACLAAALLLFVRRSWLTWRVWAVLGLLVLLGVTASAYAEFEIPGYLRRPAAGGWPSFWQAVDLMIVFPLLWLPIAADHAKAATDARSAARGCFAGLLVTSVWLGVIGVLYLPATATGDVPGFLVGMELGVGALAILAVLQLDEAVANAQAASLFGDRKLPVPPAILVVLIAIPAAVLWHIGEIEPYVLLVGAAFVPAFGVVISAAVLKAEPRPGVAALSWIGGFLIFQWITPADVGWWRDLLDQSGGIAGVPFPLTDEVTWLGGSIPAFLFAFAVFSAAELFALPDFTRRLLPKPGEN